MNIFHRNDVWYQKCCHWASIPAQSGGTATAIAGSSPQHCHGHRDTGQEGAGLARLHISEHLQVGAGLAGEGETQQPGTCWNKASFTPRSRGLQRFPEQGEVAASSPASCLHGGRPLQGRLHRAMEVPPTVLDFTSRASSAHLPVRPLMRTLLFMTSPLLPIANTSCMHIAGERPREQNSCLWSDEGCQMGCQPTRDPVSSAAGSS